MIDALMTAGKWPGASLATHLALAVQLRATRQFAKGYKYFADLADQPVQLAIAGMFQALDCRLDDALSKLDTAVAAQPGLPNFFRGVTLHRAGRDATADLELVVALGDQFPPGLVRAARSMVAGTGMPDLTTDYSVTERDGFRFGPARLIQPVSGVYVAQGYDFGDFSFVSTGDGLVAIDSGSTPDNAAAALKALREFTDQPITHVILTHAHFDHIGGLEALRGPDTQVIAQAGFPAELASQNDGAMPWRRFLPAGATHRHQVVPDRLIHEPTTVGDFVLYPVHGGETDDALIVHVPDRGVVFAGDILMPYLGAPFFAEGSAEGLFEAMRLVERLAPETVIHGHIPLTRLFQVAVFPALRAALEDLYGVVLDDLRAGRTLTDLLRGNHLPEVLRTAPDAVVPYLALRDNMIKRVHRQRTGYWQPDREGMEHISDTEWAAALDLLAGGDPSTYSRAVRALLDRGEVALAERVAGLALRTHDDAELAGLRQESLVRLVEQHQGLDPFKFLIYSELAGIELTP